MIQFVHIVTLATISLVYVIYRWLTNPLRKIPGPPKLPFIGNLHQTFLCERPHILFAEWSRKYGDVMCLQMVNDYVVILNSPDVIKEAMVEKGVEFGGRPSTFRVKYSCYNGGDMSFQSYSPKVHYMRKVCHWAIKTYGLGMKRLERIVQEQIADLVDRFAGFEGQSCDPNPEFHTLFCNVMTSMIFGKRFTPSSEEVKQVITFDRYISSALHPTDTSGLMLDSMPWLRYFRNASFERLKVGVEARDEFLDQQFKTMKETLNEDDLRGIFDALLMGNDDIVDGKKNLGSSKVHLTDREIKAIIFDLVIAGSVTSSMASTMAVLVLLNYPDIQRKLHQEISNVIPDHRLPTIEDRAQLPYMEAFILELLRYVSHVPLGLPHVTLDDTTVGNYAIPRGTQVLVNAWAVDHDERYYKDPWTFTPDRFLEEDGSLVAPDHPARRNLLAFSTGRRICVGENLAKSRISLLFASLLQRFDILPEHPGNVPSCDPRTFSMGLVLLPAAFKCRFIARKTRNEML